MEIARLTEQVIEYLLISSALLFLLGMLSLLAVRLLGIKGKTKIWIFVLVFILPVIYPVRSFLPESIRIPVSLQSDYLKPLSVISGRNQYSSETSILPIAPEAKEKFTISKILATKKEVSSLSVKEMALYSASMFYKNWKQVAAMLWVLIFSIFFIRLIAATNTIKKLMRFSSPVTEKRIIELLNKCASDTGLSYVPMLYEVHGISTPMAMGFLRPVIVIPSHLVTENSAEGLRFTLLHELKHIDQRHNLWLFIESLIGAIFFFHPVIHWVKRKIHEEMEHICDGHVIKITHKSATYADFLLNEIWQNNPARYPIFSLPFISSTSKTADRIRSILENRVASASMPVREIITTVSVFIVFLSFIIFTGTTRVQRSEKVADPITSETVDSVTAPIQAEYTENIKAASVTTPLTSPKNIKAKKAVITRSNTQTANKRKYITDIPIDKSGTAPVKHVNSTSEDRDIEKTLQTTEQIPEQTESLTVNEMDSSKNISQETDIPVTETMVGTSPSQTEITVQKYLGPPVNELTIPRIEDIRVLDEYTILFIMRGGSMYLTRLKEPCPALIYASYFKLDSTIGTISKFDRIKSMSNGDVIGSTAMLGEFYSYKYEGSKADAIKLLKKTLLKDLVAEGAFK